MKISIIIPTHRTSTSAIARVCEAAALDPARFEIIVRDNSEDPAKTEILQRLQSPAVRLFTAPNKGAVENAVSALASATGEFAFFLADDDWISAKGLHKLHALAEPLAGDESVSLLTGTYFIEMSGGCGMLRYSGIDAADAVERLTGYIKANAPNVLYYSAVRRPLLSFCMELVGRMPYKFSFHDITMVLLYLALGRAVQTDHVVYFYDQSEWETQEGTLAKDRAWYRAAGLPIEFDRLHWLICGLEGALLLNSGLLASHPGNFDRQKVSDLWFAAMFNRFRHWQRDAGWSDNAANAAARGLQEKWIASPEANLNELLIDLCDVFETADKEGADRYFQFWSAL